ncbi:hypothetical protein [Erythrobacter sp. YT30]|uniref:hypothetical protein n=1 Tax=Erythrobacter sp. YT30 TaxID=1735012 RepID=UPI00076C4D50|nr:hypothetical protein [Erythrobacter sp. YT30]KWV93279.1 hypothetical protein AUC45_03970 [Erythrobacter sp. YT30]
MSETPNLFDEALQSDNERDALTERWFALTRQTLPSLAKERDWPVDLDHCFMRILLDNAFGGAWREFVDPPAYRNAPLDILKRAMEIGEEIAACEADIWELNRRSLKWRGKI